MEDDLIGQLEEFYLHRLESGETSSEKLGWESVSAHYSRFKVLSDFVDCEYKRILDVGSGLGDLYQFLLDKGIACTYAGVDILDHMVHRAQIRFPGIKFCCMDIISNPGAYGDSCDVLFSAGIFNLKSYSNLEFLKKGFDAFVTLAAEAIVISLLHYKAPEKEADVYCYFDPQEVIHALSRPGWDIEINDGYLLNDFAVIARRKV